MTTSQLDQNINFMPAFHFARTAVFLMFSFSSIGISYAEPDTA